MIHVDDKVRDYIKTIGLYRNKAKNVIALSEKLIAEFGGEVPRSRAGMRTATPVCATSPAARSSMPARACVPAIRSRALCCRTANRANSKSRRPR